MQVGPKIRVPIGQKNEPTQDAPPIAADNKVPPLMVVMFEILNFFIAFCFKLIK